MPDLISLPRLEELMDAAWPAPDRHDTGEWVLRAADGVTQRANSVWPRAAAADPVAAARNAAAWYRDRRLPVIYQMFARGPADPLDALLDRQGFSSQSETLIMAMPGNGRSGYSDAPVHSGLGHPAVEISRRPSAEWAELWWSVDGRGGADQLAIALGILTACPSLYAMVRDDGGRPAAVGRLAVPPGGPDGWGGLYCMATRPDARRQGHAGRVVRALLDEGSAQGLAGYWLLVMASNAPARELYTRAGFREAARYVYRQAPLKRAGSGC
jgi:ribosomal protein S18 acetylase RimI-like enzyme